MDQVFTYMSRCRRLYGQKQEIVRNTDRMLPIVMEILTFLSANFVTCLSGSYPLFLYGMIPEYGDIDFFICSSVSCNVLLQFLKTDARAFLKQFKLKTDGEVHFKKMKASLNFDYMEK